MLLGQTLQRDSDRQLSDLVGEFNPVLSDLEDSEEETTRLRTSRHPYQPVVALLDRLDLPSLALVPAPKRFTTRP